MYIGTNTQAGNAYWTNLSQRIVGGSRINAADIGIMRRSCERFDRFISGDTSAFINFEAVEGSLLMNIHAESSNWDSRSELRSSYFRSLFEISDISIANERLGAIWDNHCVNRSWLVLAPLANNRNDGFFTIESAMERYAFLHAEVHRAFEHDSELLRQNLEALNGGFLNHMHGMLGVFGVEVMSSGWSSAFEMSNALAFGFIQGIDTGMGFEEAKQFAFERVTEEFGEYSPIAIDNLARHFMANSRFSLAEIHSLFTNVGLVSVLLTNMIQQEQS
ncbi:MAG: hypothetical protein FWF76_03450 [Oscillospiraceae bacterium]|nr:hypothetical protein [Oscillospiraceae bacterium]